MNHRANLEAGLAMAMVTERVMEPLLNDPVSGGTPWHKTMSRSQKKNLKAKRRAARQNRRRGRQ